MSVRMQYLSWACFAFEVDGRRIVVDPYLEGFPDLGVAPSAVRGADVDADVILVTHAAADHIGEALQLMRECDAVLCGSLDVQLKALDAGFPQERTAVFVSGATFDAGGCVVKALDAKHISFSRHNGGYLTGQPLSYILDFGDIRVYHGGDTSISADMQLFGRLYRPHVAILGVDGVLVNGRPIVEMDPHEASVAAELLGASLAIPMHYRPGSGAAAAFVAQVNTQVPHCRGLELDYGQTIDLQEALTAEPAARA
jgi:L-ascorbate metabolism protein UlaG (beta-lactamase superfamily)